MMVLAVSSVFVARFLVLTYHAARWAGRRFGLVRRAHEPRLWPIALVDYDTREVSYELGEFNPTVGRACIRW